jgi:hypothetical protein
MHNHHAPWLHAFTFGLHAAVITQHHVDHPTFEAAHRAQLDGTPLPNSALRSTPCHLFELHPPPVAVARNIDDQGIPGIQLPVSDG